MKRLTERLLGFSFKSGGMSSGVRGLNDNGLSLSDVIHSIHTIVNHTNCMKSNNGEQEMKAIETRSLGPTDTIGARIVASTEGGNRLVMLCNSSADIATNHANAASKLRSKMQWEGNVGECHMVGGSTKSGMAWVFTDSDSPHI